MLRGSDESQMRFQAAFEPAGGKVFRAQRRQQLRTLRSLRILERRRHDVMNPEPVIAGTARAEREASHIDPYRVIGCKTRAKVAVGQRGRIRHIESNRYDV